MMIPRISQFPIQARYSPDNRAGKPITDIHMKMTKSVHGRLGTLTTDSGNLPFLVWYSTSSSYKGKGIHVRNTEQSVI